MENVFKTNKPVQTPVQEEWKGISPVRHELEHSWNRTVTVMYDNSHVNSETTHTTAPRAQRAVDITGNREAVAQKNNGEQGAMLTATLASRYSSYLKNLENV